MVLYKIKDEEKEGSRERGWREDKKSFQRLSETLWWTDLLLLTFDTLCPSTSFVQNKNDKKTEKREEIQRVLVQLERTFPAGITNDRTRKEKPKDTKAAKSERISSEEMKIFDNQ